jgi:hypothetical protein
MKPGNLLREDPGKGRRVRERELREGKMTETLNSGDTSTRLKKVAELATTHPERAFASLHHVIDVAWLREAHRRTRKDAATGVDGQTAESYARDLESNLTDLLGRLRMALVVTGPGGAFVLELTMGVLTAYLPTEAACATSAPQWASHLWPARRDELEAWCINVGARLAIDETAHVDQL